MWKVELRKSLYESYTDSPVGGDKWLSFEWVIIDLFI